MTLLLINDDGIANFVDLDFNNHNEQFDLGLHYSSCSSMSDMQGKYRRSWEYQGQGCKKRTK